MENVDILHSDAGSRVVVLETKSSGDPSVLRKSVHEARRQVSAPRRRYDSETLVEREVRALEMLRDLPFVPKLIERDTPTSFVVSFVEGVSLKAYAGILDEGYYRELRKQLDLCEASGVFRIGHNPKDFLVSPDGTPAIIDFGNVMFREEGRVLTKLISVGTRVRVWDVQRRKQKGAYAGKPGLETDLVPEVESTLIQ